MNFADFEKNVQQWAKVRGIYDQSSEEKQIEKFMEEREEFMDAIGDMAVCLVNAMWFNKPKGFMLEGEDLYDVGIHVSSKDYRGALTTLCCICGCSTLWEQCLELAWNSIKDRKGVMIDGLFVKEASMTDVQKELYKDQLEAQ